MGTTNHVIIRELILEHFDHSHFVFEAVHFQQQKKGQAPLNLALLKPANTSVTLAHAAVQQHRNCNETAQELRANASQGYLLTRRTRKGHAAA